jgi:NADPH-dependent 2,4-dienoyl-CoA reductase/sulfur reductase-like enzyme
MARRAVIVGASLAGLRAAGSLRHHGHDGSIVAIGNEEHMPYDRPPLSKQLLIGKTDADGIGLPVQEGLDVDWALGRRASGLDLDRQAVMLDDGDEVRYDLLVIATGAHPRVIPSIPPGPGVHYLRTIGDSLALRDDLRSARSAVIVGAGFIGLEVASSALQMGVTATVLEALPAPLERVLGPSIGAALADWHRGHGVDLRLGTAVESLLVSNSGRPEGLRLSDGTVIDADVVVVGIGAAPTTGWLAGSGVDVADGVICDERLHVMASGSPVTNVVAAGDVARWMHPVHRELIREEHWTNASSQGEQAGLALMQGDRAESYGPIPYVWSDQHGAKLQFVGRALPGDEMMLVEGSVDEGRFLAAYGRDGRLVAGLGMRRPTRVIAIQQLIAEGAGFPPEM